MDTMNLECDAFTSEFLETAYIWRHNGLRIEIDNTNFLRRLAYEQVSLIKSYLIVAFLF